MRLGGAVAEEEEEEEGEEEERVRRREEIKPTADPSGFQLRLRGLGGGKATRPVQRNERN